MNPFYQNEEFALNRNPAVFLFVYHFLLRKMESRKAET